MGYGRAGRPKNSERVYRPTAEAVEAERAMRKACAFYSSFRDEGPLRRALYPKQVAFMAAGREWKQRAFLAGNRTGKTTVAAFELVCHATGAYPSWWTGRRFETAVDIWVAGDTAGTARDILQTALLGPTSTIETREWCGMIPRTMVYDVARKPGVPLAVSSIWVRHTTGGMSSIEIKSYDQKRESYQGTTKAMIWLDEEPPEDIYGECLMRTMTSDGLMVVTFTPLQGLTPFIASWLERSVVDVLDEYGRSQLRPAKSEVFKGIEVAEMPAEEDFKGSAAPKEEKGTRYIVMATWDDAPHLTTEMKDAMLLEFPIHQRDARSKGIPALGSGVIYPIPEGDIRVSPFEIPEVWPRCWGLDTDSGAGWTACVWLAKDPNTNTYYLYDVYKRHHGELSGHIAAIKARGAWIPGVADAAALLVTAHDSQQVIALYRQAGLDVVLPDKAVEAGISAVLSLLTAGRLKVFASCGAFFEEYRLYRRDGKGRIVKQADHAIDACVVGDTPVWTSDGPAPIRDLVGRDGWCVSRDGVMARFLGARKVFENVPVVTVSFADGSSVTCTPDHPFLTPDGWMRADTMTGRLCSDGISQRITRVESRLSTFHTRSSARMPVKVGRVEHAMWTTWNVAAVCARRCLWLTGTAKYRHAGAYVACTKVVPTGSADVYCLTVPGLSAFAVGAGVIVHNTRYACVSGIGRMRTKPLPKDAHETGLSLSERSQSWLA